jgi:hypothetical protein
MWRYLPAGATGRLLGWRDENRAIVDMDETDRKLVVFLGTSSVERARQPGLAYRRAG